MTQADPIVKFQAWWADAKAADPSYFDAMCLSTISAEGRPSARMVLLKSVDARGFVFFTNFESRKGRELLARPFAALTFHWSSLERQVRVEGSVTVVSNEEADSYFASRPRGSRLGAWASEQSRPLESRATLERRWAEFEGKFAGSDVPRPPHWSGFRVDPERIEFWQGQPSRLHDREVHARRDGVWTIERLYP